MDEIVPPYIPTFTGCILHPQTAGSKWYAFRACPIFNSKYTITIKYNDKEAQIYVSIYSNINNAK